MSGDNSGLQGAAFTVSWELDLWGRVRCGRAAAAADARSAQADYEFARQSLAALVAKSWFLATEAGLQANVARETLRQGDELVRLAQDRVRIGVGNDEDVYIARAAQGPIVMCCGRSSASSDSRARSSRPLSRGRGGRSAVAGPARRRPVGPSSEPARTPAGRDCGRTAHRHGVQPRARGESGAAARYRLTTGVSTVSSDLFVLQDRDNPVWNLGCEPVPVFRGGALKTQVEIRTAEQKQTVAAYAAVGLGPSARSRTPCRGDCRARAGRFSLRRSPTTGGRSRWCRTSSRSAAPICAS